MADNTFTFIVSDQSINVYGYRVLNSGIDLKQFKRNPIMLYMHKRNMYDAETTGAIGYWENLRMEGDKLLADAVFDSDDTFAQKIKKKVENKVLRMASIGINVIETSKDAKHLVKGQTRPTVTKSVLKEISIVDIGGNDNALKLYDANNTELELSDELLGEITKPNINVIPDAKFIAKALSGEILGKNTNTNNMSDLKTIAKALKLSDESTIGEVLGKIGELQQTEASLADFKKKQKAAQKEEAIKLFDKASDMGLIPEALKEGQLAAFSLDFKGTKAQYETLFADAEKEKGIDTSINQQLADFDKAQSGLAKGGGIDEKLSYDYLLKHNPKQLQQLKSEDLDTYNKLVADYASGVRYNP